MLTPVLEPTLVFSLTNSVPPWSIERAEVSASLRSRSLLVEVASIFSAPTTIMSPVTEVSNLSKLLASLLISSAATLLVLIWSAVA